MNRTLRLFAAPLAIVGLILVSLVWPVGPNAVPASGTATARLSEIERTHPRRIASPAPRPRQGITGPAAAALGLTPRALLLLVVLAGAALAVSAQLNAPRTAADNPPLAARRWLAAALLLAGACAVRFAAMRYLAFDGDERSAAPLSVFEDDHDAWVHPPVFRLLQLRWTLLVDGELRAWRGLSTTCSCIAAAVAVWSTRREGWLAWLPIAALVLSPTLAEPQVLARPYGLAMLLMTLVLWTLTTSEGPIAWSVAVLSAGLTAWCDVSFGAVAGVLLIVRAIQRRRHWPRSTATRFALLTGLLVWFAPVAVGAGIAARSELNPTERETAESFQPGESDRRTAPGHRADRPERQAEVPNLRPTTPWMPRLIEIATAAGYGTPVGLIATLVIITWRRRWDAFALLGSALVCSIVATALIDLRMRTLLYLPLVAAFATLMALSADTPRAPTERGS